MDGQGPLLDQAAAKAREMWLTSGLVDHAQDKIILYVATRNEASALAALLNCAAYTSTVADTAEEKEKILSTWIDSASQPYMVATWALGLGFDYAHVRIVIHVGELRNSLVDFAQESGRAGRDGAQAFSLVLLRQDWVPNAKDRMLPERKPVYEFLDGLHCRRRILSEYLDTGSEVIFECPGGAFAKCDACRRRSDFRDGHAEVDRGKAREMLPEQEFIVDDDDMNFGSFEFEAWSDDDDDDDDDAPTMLKHTGSVILQEKLNSAQVEFEQYERDLRCVAGTCLLCRGAGASWEHRLNDCSSRGDYFEARNRARAAGQKQAGGWIARFHACYHCYQPQSICARAASEGRQRECEYSDVVMPLCYGLWLREQRGLDSGWLRTRTGRSFTRADEFLLWCGRASRFGGTEAIEGVRIAAAALAKNFVLL